MQELFFIVSHCRSTLHSKPGAATRRDRQKSWEGVGLGGGASGGRSHGWGWGGAEGQI